MRTGLSNERNRAMWRKEIAEFKRDYPKNNVVHLPSRSSREAGYTHTLTNNDLRALFADALRDERVRAAQMRKSESLYTF